MDEAHDAPAAALMEVAERSVGSADEAEAKKALAAAVAATAAEAAAVGGGARSQVNAMAHATAQVEVEVEAAPAETSSQRGDARLHRRNSLIHHGEAEAAAADMPPPPTSIRKHSAVPPHRNATPYDRPARQRRAATPSSSSGDEFTEATTRHRRAVERISFVEATVKLFVDERGVGRICGAPGCDGCAACQLQERLRSEEGSAYYPASPKQRAAGRELAKVRRKPAGKVTAFCECKDRCSRSCPCAEGLGCHAELLQDGTWWGCRCESKCESGIGCYVFDAAAIDQVRRDTLRGVRLGLAGAG